MQLAVVSYLPCNADISSETEASYPMSVEFLDIAIRIVLVVATAFLFALVLAAYLRLKNRKLLFISIGFGIFFIHALIYIPEVLTPGFLLNENAHLLIHLIALIFIVVGILTN